MLQIKQQENQKPKTQFKFPTNQKSSLSTFISTWTVDPIRANTQMCIK